MRKDHVQWNARTKSEVRDRNGDSTERNIKREKDRERKQLDNKLSPNLCFMANRDSEQFHKKRGTIHQPSGSVQVQNIIQSCSQKKHHLVAHLAHSYHREQSCLVHHLPPPCKHSSSSPPGQVLEKKHRPTTVHL